ncbi:hypothetical protein GCM10009122_14330 [Fulvivirga kasyanovii]
MWSIIGPLPWMSLMFSYPSCFDCKTYDTNLAGSDKAYYSEIGHFMLYFNLIIPKDDISG